MTTQTKRRISIVTIYASCAAVLGLLGYVCRAQDLAYDMAIRPAVEKTVCDIISDSTRECREAINQIRVKQNLNDTNILTIKYLIEAMATNDQIIRAKNRRSNPTGIR